MTKVVRAITIARAWAFLNTIIVREIVGLTLIANNYIKRLFNLSVTHNSNVLTPISTLLKLHEHSTNEKVVFDTILNVIIAVFIMIR